MRSLQHPLFFSEYFKSAEQVKIVIIGLGYVGLPLAIEFAKKYNVLGFDTNAVRVKELKTDKDVTRQVNAEDLQTVIKLKQKNANGIGLHFSSDEKEITNYNVFIVTVPTPINKFKSPDLQPLLNASEVIGKVIKKNNIIIYESTVYPGCTETDCVPVLERASGLKYNEDFFVGYSPERVNPGDKVNTLTTIKKVTSGSTPSIANIIDYLYASIIDAGTHKAPSIKVAEASKAIENAQRDINISFVNELALIFDRMNIDTNDVLEAAGTKWNFLKYKPGLVGGHCIGIDPYYLAHKAESLGYHPQVILSGRRVNDYMGVFVANKVIKLLIAKGHNITTTKALILGITFKENCSDVRNTKVVDIYNELKEFGVKVDIYDPWASYDEVKERYNVELIKILVSEKIYDAIILAVAHDEFLSIDYSAIKRLNGVIFDTKACLNREIVDARL
jgi:UDP-N-acetyl-D-galactosamine dehydrogenase